MNKLTLPVMVILLYLCVVDQMLVVAETSAPMHKLTFLTNALPFVCEKGEKSRWTVQLELSVLCSTKGHLY